MTSKTELGFHDREKSKNMRKMVIIVSMNVLLMATLVGGPSPAYAQETGALQFHTTASGYEIRVE